MTFRHGQNAIYAAVLAMGFVVSIVAGWTSLGIKLDDAAYDWMFVQHPPKPWQPQSVLLVIDEESFRSSGGVPGLRKALADSLDLIRAASPQAVALDVTLADQTDEISDSRLEAALRSTPNLVLPCDLIANGSAWEDPIPRFKKSAAAIGHVHAEPGRLDAITRAIPLEKAASHDRRWALALEAFRVCRKAFIVESPKDLQVANVTIPAPEADGRPMRIRYRPPEMAPIPRVSLKQLRDTPALAAQFSGKMVFAGITAQMGNRDKLMTPLSLGLNMAGVEIHANAFETIAQQMFLIGAPAWTVVAFCAALTAAAGLAFALLPGWQANALSLLLLATAHAAPFVMFGKSIVFPISAPASAAWISIMIAGAWRHFVVRRRLAASETERVRYQHAMHFVTHEMRTPLTAIQGSSELMSRYAMPEEKRKQIAELINSESKRLGRMIEMFLNVERLSAGQMELKQDDFSPRELISICMDRARPLADRKQIRVLLEAVPEDAIRGDRELMEYAFYNLLTNAVKYSGPQTEVRVFGSRSGGRVRISVKDQGIGMDQKEVRKVFQKFYRTRRAEESGEAGTGIGLSIVEQIVTQHGGAISVESRPGKGSCFTVDLPVRVGQAVAPARI